MNLCFAHQHKCEGAYFTCNANEHSDNSVVNEQNMTISQFIFQNQRGALSYVTGVVNLTKKVKNFSYVICKYKKYHDNLSNMKAEHK
jgi:hypothetical protein